MKTVWQTIEVPVQPSHESWKQYLGEICPHGRQIVLVDGTYVRDHFDSDFSQGGNGYRYPKFISRKEIWIDAQVSQAEWSFIAFHECEESERMKLGWTYGRAHDVVKRMEDHLRRVCRR